MGKNQVYMLFLFPDLPALNFLSGVYCFSDMWAENVPLLGPTDLEI